ncbi:MAG: hypothetical protein MUO76_17230 [Anaerolineaceae bacterium]|nr:hypothetical protein [Anaerolineaceae bacterium]
MKKALILILIAILLSSCGQTLGGSDDDMATRVAQILTEEAPQITQTELPVLAAPPVSKTPITVQDASITPESTSEVIIITPTATATVPTNTPTITDTPEPTLTGTTTLTNTPEASATPLPSDPRTILGPPSSTDIMSDTNTWNWPTGSQQYTSLAFKDGFLVFTGLTDVAGWRLPMTAAATDIYIEMTVRTGECTGEDNYGIIYRIPVFHEADRGYLFTVSCDGRYRLTKWDGKEGENGAGIRLITWRSSAYINAGPNQTNRIGVMTKGNRFYLFANGYYLNRDFILEDSDNPYPGGHFGIFVTSRETANFTIYVDEMSYWLSTFTP